MSDSPLVRVRSLQRLEEPRGWFLKVIQRVHLEGRPFGEVYVAVAAPGEVRGSHYHRQTNEWFCPIGGQGTLYVASQDGAEHQAIVLDSAQPVSVRVPAGVSHALVADRHVEFSVLAVADKEYDPADNDTFPVELELIQGNDS